METTVEPCKHVFVVFATINIENTLILPHMVIMWTGPLFHWRECLQQREPCVQLFGEPCFEKSSFCFQNCVLGCAHCFVCNWICWSTLLKWKQANLSRLFNNYVLLVWSLMCLSRELLQNPARSLEAAMGLRCSYQLKVFRNVLFFFCACLFSSVFGQTASHLK